MISLGREPQVRGDQTTNEPPEGATDSQLKMLVSNRLSPLRGLLVFLAVFLGLTPQANHLSPLRG